ncbi:serine--tRNA ligase [Patescibacteria group bacterium]|nr:serine--tRNA ligase [Patescibacteria group bacterium]
MLDIKFIRENKGKVKQACKNKQVKVDIDKLLKVDKERREIQTELEKIFAQKNKASKEISKAKDKKEKQKIISEMQKIDKKGDKLKESLKKIDKEFEILMYQVPNIALDDVPVGKSENDNVVMRKVGEKTRFDFKPKDYLEIAEKYDLIDVKRAAKVSGTRFGYLKNQAVLLEFALINLAFDILVKEKFTPIIPPVMIKSDKIRGMGYLEQSDVEEAYYLPKDDLFLAGTAEQPIGTMHADEIFEEKNLAKRYLGFSSCFRREAGSYGKDTKGILRVHQFDKIEMFSFCKPEDSIKEYKFLLGIEEKLMQFLKIPYQVVQICTGDLARPSAATYDIEAWMPSQNQYRETHSASNCTDFQARRLNIRYRDKNNKLNFVHTLNGTGFAMGRTIIAIIENYQQKDGSVKVPEVLQKYTGFKEIK